jgi:hypothetical protein
VAHGLGLVPEAVVSGGRLRVGLLGHWGTRLYGAPVSVRSIERDGRYDLLLHLGEVYYSGTEKEVQELFLDRWPKVPGAPLAGRSTRAASVQWRCGSLSPDVTDASGVRAGSHALALADGSPVIHEVETILTTIWSDRK